MTRILRLFPVAMMLAILVACLPMFRQPEALPVKRLVANLAVMIKKQPKDAELLFKMARLHYLAFTNNSVLVPAWETDRRGAPNPAPAHLARRFAWSLRYDEATRVAKAELKFDDKTKMDRAKWQQLDQARKAAMKKLEAEGWKPAAPTSEQLHAHAEQAMVFFDRAIAVSPKQALYHLGRASLGEQCLDLELAGKLPRRRVLKGHDKLSYKVVRDQFLATFDLANKKEIADGYMPIEGLRGLVSYEAGHAFLKLTKKSEKLGKDQENAIKRVTEGLAKLKGLRRGPITPILLAKEADARLADLVDPDASVAFDLDGDGQAEQWPWLKPAAGILAWDPLRSANITSGRQLFGSVTWNLFHRDGYAALRLLDDDGDGELRGLELDGLVIWHDQNGDGKSSPTEVESIWQAVVALQVAGAVDGDGVLTNEAGVRYRDGVVAPTFDWVTKRR